MEHNPYIYDIQYLTQPNKTLHQIRTTLNNVINNDDYDMFETDNAYNSLISFVRGGDDGLGMPAFKYLLENQDDGPDNIQQIITNINNFIDNNSQYFYTNYPIQMQNVHTYEYNGEIISEINHIFVEMEATNLFVNLIYINRGVFLFDLNHYNDFSYNPFIPFEESDDEIFISDDESDTDNEGYYTDTSEVLSD